MILSHYSDSVNMSFNKHSPGGHVAMALILQMDGVVHVLGSMVRLGILKRQDAGREIDALTSRIRSMMTSPGAWVPTGCSRRDLAERNDTAVAAVKCLMGRSFIDRSLFSDPGELCDYFACYGYRPEHALVVGPQTLSGYSAGRETEGPLPGAISR
ncbi:MAG: DUF1845 domain-containing protein [Gammaproteobacteria bacterium]|nr:DUF1845 domain-containing protein [Gammaproteobacteria bacterium]